MLPKVIFLTVLSLNSFVNSEVVEENNEVQYLTKLFSEATNNGLTYEFPSSAKEYSTENEELESKRSFLNLNKINPVLIF